MLPCDSTEVKRRMESSDRESVSDVDVGKNIMEDRSSWCGSVEAGILPRNFDHLPQNRHRSGRRIKAGVMDRTV